MKANAVLEVLWHIKDTLAAQAGGNVDRLCEQTREWATAHPHDGLVVRNYELERIIESRQPMVYEVETEPYAEKDKH